MLAISCSPFIAAVAFATIVAVVAGLLLAATSAIAHDLYIGVIRNGQAGRPAGAPGLAAIGFGIVAIVPGIVAKGAERRPWWPLAFAVAAPANFRASC